MTDSDRTQRLLFLLLLFTGTVSASMIIPFMAYFLVEGLGHEPWIISVYTALAISLTVTTNRVFARRIDSGARVFPLVGIAATGYITAAAALTLVPSLWMALTIGVLGFGLSSSAVSTMFSLGGSLAEGHAIERSRFNAYMRATTSTAWMVGPALSFTLADQLGLRAVFATGLGIALIWLALWWGTLPRDITASAAKSPTSAEDAKAASRGLWLATGFVFFLSFAHSLTFSSLPIFYVAEVGLPGYAPGLAFSIKTFVEVFAIFSTPMLIARFGIRTSLIATTLLAIVATRFIASVTTFEMMLVGAALEGLYYGLFASLGISYVQSFAKDAPARATAIYWNTLMISGLIAGPAVGLIAQVYDFGTVILVATGVAVLATLFLIASRRGTTSPTRPQSESAAS